MIHDYGIAETDSHNSAALLRLEAQMQSDADWRAGFADGEVGDEPARWRMNSGAYRSGYACGCEAQHAQHDIEGINAMAGDHYRPCLQ